MEYVKVCGLKIYNDIQLSINHGATAVGFIYDVLESPRNLGESKINMLIKNIPKDIKTVLVFKPKNIIKIRKVVNKINTNLYQIHGNFDNKELEKIPENLKKRIIVATKLNRRNINSVFNLINQFQDRFFAFLIDNSEGHGKVLDFDIVQEILKNRGKARIILAGGINIENVTDIVKKLNPYGIDVSSSLEIEKGVKDPYKITQFLDKVNYLKQKLIM
jgi:phosphoribosylanthranilate isomerase